MDNIFTHFVTGKHDMYNFKAGFYNNELWEHIVEEQEQWDIKYFAIK